MNWAVEQKIALKDKIAIMGGSYGGYATLVGLTFTPDVFACGVDTVGPSSLITLMENMGRRSIRTNLFLYDASISGASGTLLGVVTS